MLIRGVDFPEDVLNAQQDGSLVVFAGAGVSVSAPSSLPNFRSLAREVSAGTAVTLDDDSPEPLDHFLGRLSHQGVKVHDRAARILSAPISQPNALHSSLLRLFDGAAALRLVTTNFDVHFTTAARTQFDNDRRIEVYSAPALPLGHDFHGLVHLHGSLDGPQDRLILTDADFGRAYLTQGWATRFLRELFSAYTVLFVGYSHDDPVMNYLARGLPPRRSDGPQRFVLTPDRSEASWGFLGIVPVTYQLQDGNDPHASARAAIAGWADFAGVGMIEHEERIRMIVQGAVPADPETLDYLKRILGRVATARFFTRYARTVPWLRWGESTGKMADLFKQNAPYRELDAELGFWFAREFACEESGEALALVRRQGQNLSPLLSRVISHQLFAKRPRPSPEVLGRWIPLLLRSHPSHQRQDFLQYLLHELTFPDSEAIALLLFGYLTKPSILLTEKFWAMEKENSAEQNVDIELTTGGEDHWLTQAWQTLFLPNIDTCGDGLLRIAISNLQEAYLLLRASGKTGKRWDPISGSRGLIESTSQGSHRGGVGILIDVVRELLEWSINKRPEDADYFVSSWFRSDFLIFRRLAVYGVSKNQWTSDDKLSWLVQKDLIHRYPFKHETFLVLRGAYPKASLGLRRRILELAMAGPKSDLPEDTKQYEIYNLLHWLSEAAPDCPLANAQLDEMRKRHPDYAPRAHPDMDRWRQLTSGHWRGEPSPLTADELLARSPEDLLDLLNSLDTDEHRETGRRGLLSQVVEATAKSGPWGLQLGDFLRRRSLSNNDLWPAITEGAQRSSFTEDEWKSLLEMLITVNAKSSFFVSAASRLLEIGTQKSDAGIPASLSDLTVQLIKILWSACTESIDKPKDGFDDWVMTAINNPAGWLMECSISMLFRVNQGRGRGDREISADYKALLGSVLSGSSYAAELGRVIIASNLFFLYGLDGEWTVTNVVPVLSWSENPKYASQAWHGYLRGTNWTNDLLPHLIPCFEETFARLHTDFSEDSRRHFCQYVAGIVCFSSADQTRSAFLNHFIARIEMAERITWAGEMAVTLESMDDLAREKAWEWLRLYWRDRIEGVPALLHPEEVGRMIGWGIGLLPMFPRVIDMIHASPAPKLEHSFLLDRVLASDLPNRHPESTAKLVLYLLRNLKMEAYEFGPAEGLLRKLASSADARRYLLEACQELASLGYVGAASLRNEIEKTTLVAD